MGQTSSTRSDPNEKKRVSEVRKIAVDRRINELNNLERHVDSSVPINIAKQQVLRSGKSLVKNDYIAIIIALEPSKANKVNELRNLSNEDLIIIIRNIIYNPNKILTSYNSLQIEDKANILNDHLNQVPVAFAIASAPPEFDDVVSANAVSANVVSANAVAKAI